MYIPEDRVAALLNLSIMQVRFILEDFKDDYKFIVKDSTYYIHSSSLNKLEKGLAVSRQLFKDIVENYYDN